MCHLRFGYDFGAVSKWHDFRMWFLSAWLETLPRTHVCIYIAHAHVHDTGDLGKLRNSTTYTHTQGLQSSALLFCRLGKLSIDQWRYRSRLGNSSAVAVTVFCSLLFQWLLLPLFRSRFRQIVFSLFHRLGMSICLLSSRFLPSVLIGFYPVVQRFRYLLL